MNSRLLFEALAKYSLGLIIVGLLLFLPAGTISWKQGQLFMLVLFLPMFIAGIVMLFKDPDLLRRRLNAKEKRSEQSLIIKLSGLMFLLAFVLAGLNYRFKWIILPDYISYLASVLFLLGYLLFAFVLKQNTFLSRTIEVSENQKVIDTGLYGIVRHPMYSATILMFLAMPLILGSLISFIILLIYPYLISKRINNEEEFLEKELLGYIEYKNKVKYKVIPYIW